MLASTFTTISGCGVSPFQPPPPYTSIGMTSIDEDEEYEEKERGQCNDEAFQYDNVINMEIEQRSTTNEMGDHKILCQVNVHLLVMPVLL